MTEKPFISVIIPVYNEPSIAGCIRSLLEQDYPAERFEILVIDNNSTDSTPQVLLQFKDTIVLLSEKKQGSYAARNKGLTKARGSILAFTDADCLQHKDWLSNIAESFQLNQINNIAAVQGMSVGVGENILARFINQQNIRNIYKKRQSDGFLTSLNTRNCAIRKEWLTNLKFDDTFLYWGDFMLGQDIVRNGGRIILNEAMINEHRNIRSMRRYIRKNCHIGSALCNSLLIKPQVLKQYLPFLAPVFQSDFSLRKKSMTLLRLGRSVVKFYYSSFLKNESHALDSLQNINALSFSWGLNRMYSLNKAAVEL